MATILIKFIDETQYDAANASITYSDPSPKRWVDVFGKLEIGDNCIFHSSSDTLYVGDYSSKIAGESVTFNNIKTVKISLDDLLRINELVPEKLAQFKRPKGPIYILSALDVNAIFNAAVAKNFISFYIIRQGSEVEILPSLKENDRIVIIDHNDKIIELSTIVNGIMQAASFGNDYFNAIGKTLSEILKIMTNAGKPNHISNIQRIISALSHNNSYKFPSFNDYYNVIHNKSLYLSNPSPARSVAKLDDDGGVHSDDGKNKTNDGLLFAKNLILYGPPGTGKTFHSVNYAVAIVENMEVEMVANEKRKSVKDRFDKYVNDGIIIFTTFHQSMSYEDFIEGIKPLKPEKNQDLKYDIEDGIFKKLCSKAESNWFSSIKKDGSEDTFEEIFEKFQDQWESNKNIKLGMKTTGKEFTIIGFTNKSIHFKKSNGNEGHTLSINTLKDIYYEKRSAWDSGVGIYYPGIIDKLKNIASSSKGADTKLNNYVIIIDEINRGNVSQIFGELITLIEDDKRIGSEEALKVTLPYSKDEFGVPPNLYIIGTMNTADRSVEALDTALRRRFSFVSKHPEENQLRVTTDGINLSKILQTINTRLRVLKDIDHTIGHAWLWNVTDIEDLKAVYDNKILPLLQEYFYNDYEKLGLVLGDLFFKSRTQISSNIFALFSGGNGLANQYDQSWQYQLKSASELTIADFKSLENQINQPVIDEE